MAGEERTLQQQQQQQQQQAILACLTKITEAEEALLAVVRAEKSLASVRTALESVSRAWVTENDDCKQDGIGCDNAPVLSASVNDVFPSQENNIPQITDQIMCTRRVSPTEQNTGEKNSQGTTVRSKLLFHPFSPKLAVWHLIGVVFIVFEAFAIPFEIGFKQEIPGVANWFVFFVNLYFIIDIAVSFSTCFFTPRDILVISRRKIAKRYIWSWFVPDLLAGIPWECFQQKGGLNSMTKMTRLLRVSRLVRLLKLKSKIPKKVQIFIEDSSTTIFVFGIVNVLLLLLGITHWMACAWYLVGSDSDGTGTWVQKFVPGDGAWVGYLYASFFALTTLSTVGYGDITAQNPQEVGFATFLLLVAAVIFPMILSVMNDLFASISADARYMTGRTQALAKYMQWRRVPRSLSLNVREHLVFEWNRDKGYSDYEDTVMEQLPPILKQELCYHIYGDILRRAPFLKWMSDVDICMRELSLLLSTVLMSRGDIVVRRGAAKETIYMLKAGTVLRSSNLKLDECSLTVDYEDDEEEDNDSSGNLASTADAFALSAFAISADRKRSLREAISDANRPILEAAELHTNMRLKEEHLAASSIGRYWRLIRGNRQCSHVSSRTVSAPSYFGESCLWEPLHTWDSPNHPPPKFSYNVCCITRAEFVTIARSAVKLVIDTHSPWLHNRFDFFRAAVLNGHRRKQSD